MLETGLIQYPTLLVLKKMIYKNPLIVEQVSNTYYNPIITCLFSHHSLPSSPHSKLIDLLQTSNRKQRPLDGNALTCITNALIHIQNCKHKHRHTHPLTLPSNLSRNVCPSS